ncbi:extensin-like [Humulus lupulus]|uniref:extensin-like n=1 Tax=Humulus lupulus TaxID=3486 RepID=UPI002B40B334|nr:extensin-like [Humulus lupulus]
MATNDPNIPEEEVNYPWRPRKQLMTNPEPDERTRLAAEAQAAQPQPPSEAQVPPPRDVHVPPRRPRGLPRKNAATRRIEQPLPPTEQPLPPAEQPAPSRPRRNTRARAPVNSAAELPAETGNNRAPAAARTQTAGNAQNVPKLAQVNSGPSRPRNGWQPLSPIQHPPSPIKYPSPSRRNTQPTQDNRERRAGRKQGNGGTARE